MSTGWSVAQLDTLPRLGLITDPSPVEALAPLAARLGLASLHVKRDDLIPALGGGNKPRKLDYLLAQPPFAGADCWQSVGGIGSGHLVAMSEAAAARGCSFTAHCFEQELDEHVARNLALIASRAGRLQYYRSRLTLVLGRLAARMTGDQAGPLIPAGGTTPAGMAGFVRAGLELAEQIKAGGLPQPDVLYVPLGTAGTAVGLSVGLGMAGLPCRIRAVAVVERLFVSRWRLQTLQRRLLAWLEAQGLAGAQAVVPVPIDLDADQARAGYGVPTEAARQACAELADHGLHLELVYSGKAMAALLRDAPQWQGRHVLFWFTPHSGRLEPAADWQERLPKSLAHRLETGAIGPLMSRRQFLLTSTVLAGGALFGWRRFGGYPQVPGWHGEVLSAREAWVLAAAAEALLPAGPPEPLEVARHVDRYLVTVPDALQSQVHLLLAAVEHITFLDGSLQRLSRLPLADRQSFLDDLSGKPGMLAQAYRGLRDLCLLGYYQVPSTWAAIGYGGPWVAGLGPGPVSSDRYEALRARPGVLPAGSRP